MKHALMVVFAAFVLAGTPVVAQQGAPDKNATASQAPNVAEYDKQMAAIQENMKKMQEQMTKLQQTQDPQERQRLLNEHWTTMQNNMDMMHGMWGAGMMGCCGMGPMASGRGMHGPMMGGHMMGWQGARDHYSRMTPDHMRQRQYMMDRYMGMQQQMMDHMMQHQHWSMQPQR